MSTCGDLLLSIESRNRPVIDLIKKRHVNLLLDRINANVISLIRALTDEELQNLSSDIGSIPKIRNEYIHFVQCLTSSSDEKSITSLVEKLRGYASNEDRVKLTTSIENDWNVISQIITDTKLENYIALVTKDIEALEPVIREYYGKLGLYPILSSAISTFKPMRLQNFVKIHQVGQGAYGDVWLAEDIVNKIPVALKKLKLNDEREGFPKNVIREIVLLNSLKHKNIVDLLGITYSHPENENTKENVWMVFEYLPFDLSGYIEALRDPREKCDKLIHPSIWLSIGEVKNIMKQLFRAICFCHRNNVLHRDLKTANLLMTQDGLIKLADFGLARFLPHGKGLLTNRVVTLWYRPPELLLGSEHYDYAVDMWSIGCIFAELISGTHIFAADKECIILKLIAEHLGLPDETDLKFLRTLPLWNDKNANPLHPERISSLITRHKEFERLFKINNELGNDGWDLLKKLFTWSPARRITARKALQHPWFINEPIPRPLINRPNIKAAHSFMTKNQRKRENQKNPPKRQEYVKYANTGDIRRTLEKQLANAKSIK